MDSISSILAPSMEPRGFIEERICKVLALLSLRVNEASRVLSQKTEALREASVRLECIQSSLKAEEEALTEPPSPPSRATQRRTCPARLRKALAEKKRDMEKSGSLVKLYDRAIEALEAVQKAALEKFLAEKAVRDITMSADSVLTALQVK
jgi:hypothetical protein